MGGARPACQRSDNVAAGAALSAGTAKAGPEKEKPSSLVDLFLPTQLTKEDIQASKNVKFTKLAFAGSMFWLGIVDFLGDGVPHTLIQSRPCACSDNRLGEV